MNMFLRKKALWFSMGLISTSVLLPSVAFAQEEEEELETFVITGSRIPRLDIEGPNPVLQISRDSLDSSGYATVGDALRSLPFNSGQSLTPVDSGTSFTPGVSTINLRGLGNNNVLVLVNGRRAAPFGASGFNGFQTVFDFNSIPAAAIESIEILKDGGSAIYGSDAVSGVVDIKLRRDFEGVNISAGVGNTLDTDSMEKSVFVIAGTRSAKTSIVVTADWYERNQLFARDLEFTNNTDLRNIGGVDRSSNASFPGLVFVPGSGYRSFPAPTANPTVEGSVPFGTPTEAGRAGFYNYLQDSDLYPETRFYGFYTAARHQISDTMNVFAEVSFRRAESRNASAPTPVFSFNEQGYSRVALTEAQWQDAFWTQDAAGNPLESPAYVIDPTNSAHFSSAQVAGDIMIPAYNPFNPFGVALDVENYFRLVPAGPRINDVVSDTPRILIGLDGKIGTDWTYETGFLYTRNAYTNTNPGAVQDRLLQDALHGVTFDPGTPDELTLHYNPFGPSDQRILDYITKNNPVSSRYEVRSIDFNVSGSLFDLPAGILGVAFGAEYREEDLQDYRTALNETAQIVGGGEGSSVFGSRDVSSLFAELAIPVLPMLEIQLAARYEDYSDFGDTIKPKIAAVFRALPSLIIRGGFSQSFLAPNLPYLFTSQSTSFTSAALVDPRRPDEDLRQIKQLGGGNPDLQPEETDTIYAGIAFSPESGALEGLYLGLDFFVFESDNLIDNNDAEFLLENELDAAGNPTEFAQFVIRNAPMAGESVGQINFVRTTWENLSERYYRGFDFEASYRLRTGSFGEFNIGASATLLDRLDFGGADQSGSRLLPKWRGNFRVSWNNGDWSSALFVNYIGSRDGTNSVRASGERVTNDRYDEQILVNPSISYAGFFGTTVTVGARNIFDSKPPVDYGEATRFTPGVNNPEPRFLYARVSRDF